MVIKPASLSEIAGLSASCDGECISEDKGPHTETRNRLEVDAERQQHEQVKSSKNELSEVQTNLQAEENVLKLKDENAVTSINGSDSLLIPDAENELKYGEDTPAGNILRNVNDHDDDDDDDQQEDAERWEGSEKREGNVEVEQVQEEDGKLGKQTQEKEDKIEERQDKEDVSSRNSFHHRNINKTAAETKKIASTTTTDSLATNVQADVVENVDLDSNKFIVQASNRPVGDNATKMPVKSDVVEESLLSQPEDVEIADSSLPFPSENDEVNNLIPQHTNNDGK